MPNRSEVSAGITRAEARLNLQGLKANVLLEVDPTSDFESFLKRQAELLASEGINVFVFTAEGSPLHRRLSGNTKISLVLMSIDEGPPSRKGGQAGSLSVKEFDKSVFLTVLDSLLATTGRTCVFVDSISSLAMTLGFKDTYKLLRQSMEIVGRKAASRISAVMVMTKGAHSELERSTLNSLFPVIYSYNWGGLSAVKPRREASAVPLVPNEDRRTLPGRRERRSQREMRLEVLRAIVEGTETVTRIMRKCNLTWTTLIEELKRLEELGLIMTLGDGRVKTYVGTPAGVEIAETYNRIVGATG